MDRLFSMEMVMKSRPQSVTRGVQGHFLVHYFDHIDSNDRKQDFLAVI